MQSKNDIYRFATRNTLLLALIYNRSWRSWITQQIPILKNGGSNPFERAKKSVSTLVVGALFLV